MLFLRDIPVAIQRLERNSNLRSQCPRRTIINMKVVVPSVSVRPSQVTSDAPSFQIGYTSAFGNRVPGR